MIKYIDKIQNLENKIFYSHDFELASTSLRMLIAEIKYSNSYNKKKLYSYNFVIDIINISDFAKPLSSIISEDTKDLMIDMYDAKTMLSNIAYTRNIRLSTNLDEVYSETIEVPIYTSNDGLYVFSFDYGLMYGHHQVYNNNDYVEINYTRNNETGHIIITDVNLPNTKFKLSDLRKEPSCIYYGDIYDVDDEFETTADMISIVPVSLLGNVVDEVMNNNVYIMNIKITMISNSIDVINKYIRIHANNKDEAISKITDMINKSKIEIPNQYHDIMVKATNMDDDNDTTDWVEI